MVRIPRLLLAFLILVILALLLIRGTGFGQQQEQVGAATFMPLAPGNNLIGSVTVTTILDPEQFVFDVGDLCTAVDGFLVRQALLANTLALTDSITVSGKSALVGAVTMTGTAQVKSELFADNGIQADGSITATGSALFNAASVTTTLTGLGQVRADSGLRVTQNVTQVSGSFLLNTGSVSGTLTGAGQVQADNGLRVTQNITQVSGSTILNSALVSSTLSANTLSTTDAITAGGNIHADGLWLGGDLYTTDAAQALYYGTGSFTGTLAANTLSAAQNITVTGNIQVGKFLQYTAGTTQTVVNTQPITPTATYQAIAAAVNVYTDNLLRAGALTGQLWILQNIGTPTVTITDANTCNLASTYAMGISDTLTLIFDGTSWVELGRSDN
jgi:hypothetical protein